MINYKEQYIKSLLSNICYLDFNENSELNLIGTILDGNPSIQNLYTNYLNRDKNGYLIQNFKHLINFFNTNFIIKKHKQYTY